MLFCTCKTIPAPIPPNSFVSDTRPSRRGGLRNSGGNLSIHSFLILDFSSSMIDLLDRAFQFIRFLIQKRLAGVLSAIEFFFQFIRFLIQEKAGEAGNFSEPYLFQFIRFLIHTASWGHSSWRRRCFQFIRFLIRPQRRPQGHLCIVHLSIHSFSDTVSQWFILCWCYLFVSVWCESVFV